MQQHPSVVLDSLSFSFADGTPVFERLSTVFRDGVTGIVGPNGLGKSVLLRLIAGDLTPDSGTVSRPEPVAVLPQRLTLDTRRTVAQLLGVAPAIDALAELTGASAGTEPGPDRVAELMEIIGDEWDAEAEGLAALSAAGLADLAATPGALNRTVGTLSGGEAMAVALAGLRRSRPALTLLDEPSNNLDGPARSALIGSLATWPGSVLVVSHDRALLRSADAIAELRPRRVRAGRADGVVLEQFGGNWDELQERRAAERAAAERTLRGAEADATREVRTRQAAATAAAHRSAQGAKAAETMPKILANHFRQAAEAKAGKDAAARSERVQAARSAVDEAREALRQVGGIDIDLPGTALGGGTVALSSPVPELPGRLLLDDGVPVPPGTRLTLRGPERVALLGRNGSGKTTLLESLLPDASVPVGVLRQRTGTSGTRPGTRASDGTEGEGGVGHGMRDEDSVLSNLLRLVPGLTPARAREVAARLRLRGARVEEPFGRLSGGERFRADLARVLAADPPPRLLVLDEPTNNLDLDSIEELGRALAGYGGATVVVSHDEDFLETLGPTRRWEIVGGEALAEESGGVGRD